MKIKIPEIEISETTGFEPDLDIFNRRDFGERLANLVENATDSPVIAIDSAWGEGKSTFVKMWRGHIEHHREKKLKSIYFDAFENDHQKDAFLAVTSEIYAKISNENKERKKELLKVASKTARSLARGSLKLGVQIFTSGIISGSMIGKAEDGISNLLSEQIDEIVDEKLKNIESDKKVFSDFKKEIEKFSEDEGNGAPITFIIDELDRCRPDFALALLEQIKHLFSAKGITFFLVVNRDQLEESIRSKYGSNIDTKKYLHKFINIWLSLPRSQETNNDHGEIFLSYAINKMMDEQEKIMNRLSIDTLKEIIRFHQPSLREIERILSYFSIISNITKSTLINEEHQIMSAIACYLKTIHPENLKNLEYNEIIKCLGGKNLKSKKEYPILQETIELIKFDLSDTITQTEMVSIGKFHRRSHLNPPGSALKRVLSWLQNIER